MAVKVGDKVRFFARYEGDPVREGVVVWLRDGRDLPPMQFDREVRAATGRGWGSWALMGPSRGVIIRVDKPKGGQQFFTPLAKNVTVVEESAE